MTNHIEITSSSIDITRNVFNNAWEKWFEKNNNKTVEGTIGVINGIDDFCVPGLDEMELQDAIDKTIETLEKLAGGSDAAPQT